MMMSTIDGKTFKIDPEKNKNGIFSLKTHQDSLYSLAYELQQED
jgi:hypothetical protein